jgi:membrane-associated phospholipid phosphatase
VNYGRRVTVVYSEGKKVGAATDKSKIAMTRRSFQEQILDEAALLDVSVYNAVANTETPLLDGPIEKLSNAANYSRLWFATAAVMAVFGGKKGRRSAVQGLAALAATSVAANLVVKRVVKRRRPFRIETERNDSVRMPESSSFPSGHTASAFAFSLAASAESPELVLVLVPLATAVGYSRVHTGVHFPGDVMGGAVLGSIFGIMTSVIARRVCK